MGDALLCTKASRLATSAAANADAVAGDFTASLLVALVGLRHVAAVVASHTLPIGLCVLYISNRIC